MNFVEAFRVALTALFSNRLRSILTMLGIIIGVAAVVALVSLGQSFQNYVTGQFTSIGSNLMFIVPSRPSGPGSKLLKIKPLTMADATAIANPLNVPGLAAVAPSYNVAVDISANGHSISMSITGVTTSWQSVLSWQMADGRFIDDTDNNTSSAVVVIGSTVANKLFGTGADVVGQSVRINNIPFRIVGLFKTKGGLGNQDQIAVVPLTTAQTRLGDAQARATNGGYTVSVIYAQSISKDTTQVAKTAITNLLSQRHNVQYQGNEDFQINRRAHHIPEHHRRDQSARRWDRRDEYHAGVCHRAHERDRITQGNRRTPPRPDGAVPDRKRRPYCDWWPDWGGVRWWHRVSRESSYS